MDGRQQGTYPEECGPQFTGCDKRKSAGDGKSPHATQNVDMSHWVKGKYATWHGPHTGANEPQPPYTLTHTPGCNLAPRNTCWCSHSSPLCSRTLHCLSKGRPSSGMGTNNPGPCTTPAASYKAKARPKHSHCHVRLGISGERWKQCKKRRIGSAVRGEWAASSSPCFPCQTR